ncbi:hypothetical protein ROK90_05430 [Cronobacter dublinensis]|uniref:hypothetical protein n=1 Tax=Cronobacter dublinensis TaxID=413497 RepID=UPI002895CEBE|nr:hypothetical protein [Cronobacter dublinensis]MDT3665457.1 hypothetical protein [Cronobacter dublinensis]
MSTISNERLEKMAAGGGFNFNEVEAISAELLALRKEREKVEPIYQERRFHVSGKKQVEYWAEINKGAYQYLPESERRIVYAAPPAPVVVDDSLPYDPQIAEYEQMMEAEQAQADTTAQQFESLAGKVVVTDEKGNLPCPFCGGRCDPNGWMGSYDDGVPMCGPECEDCGATASSIEEWNRRSTALAGKAVVPAGWKLVPIELTKEMLMKMHPFAEATCLGCGRQVVADCVDNVTASWNDMLAVAPEPCK